MTTKLLRWETILRRQGMLRHQIWTLIIDLKWRPRCIREFNHTTLIKPQTRTNSTKNYSKRSWEKKTPRPRSIEQSCKTKKLSTSTKMVSERLRTESIRSIRGSFDRPISRRPIGLWDTRKIGNKEISRIRRSINSKERMKRWKSVHLRPRSADIPPPPKLVLVATSKVDATLGLLPNSTSRNKSS